MECQTEAKIEIQSEREGESRENKSFYWYSTNVKDVSAVP